MNFDCSKPQSRVLSKRCSDIVHVDLSNPRICRAARLRLIVERSVSRDSLESRLACSDSERRPSDLRRDTRRPRSSVRIRCCCACVSLPSPSFSRDRSPGFARRCVFVSRSLYRKRRRERFAGVRRDREKSRSISSSIRSIRDDETRSGDRRGDRGKTRKCSHAAAALRVCVARACEIPQGGNGGERRRAGG